MRVAADVERGAAVRIVVDGQPVACFAGETVATALMAAGLVRLRDDRSGRPRGLFCNMGTCCECLVRIDGRRVRACLTPVRDGLEVATLD